ncbi:MAG TPA: NAD(P)-dependent oxidoreductase [Xanthobacteraceae bacterium]|nr:NAD(P)-dependent oxidoreductase [Xanthobacteraceae bacterium]
MARQDAFKTVGVVGLGLIGTAVSLRLIEAGFDVVGYDVDPERCAALARNGGVPAGSLADLARAAQPIVTCVFNTEQTEDVVENVIAALGENSGRIVIATSTLDPDRVEVLAARVAARGIRLIDVPVSGSSDMVREGTGLGLMGGDPVVAEEVRPVLDAVFPKRVHVGRSGNGGRAKLAINLIGGLNRLVLAEGLVFAERMGLDPKAFLEIAKRAASYSHAMEGKGAKMVSGDFVPLGRARQHLKDVQLMLDQARKLGQELPLTTLHETILKSCLAHGEGDLDNAVVINEIRRRGQTSGAA